MFRLGECRADYALGKRENLWDVCWGTCLIRSMETESSFCYLGLMFNILGGMLGIFKFRNLMFKLFVILFEFKERENFIKLFNTTDTTK